MPDELRALGRGRKARRVGGIPWLALVALFGVLLPLDPASLLIHPAVAGSPGGYAQALPQHLYLLIKAVLPWVPLGFLATLGMPPRLRTWLGPAATLLMLLSLPWLREPHIADLLEALYALPGVALGLWFGQHTLAAPPPLPHRARGRAATGAIRSPETVAEVAPEAMERPAASASPADDASPRRRHGKRRQRADKSSVSLRHSVPLMLLGAAGLALALIGALAFPIGPWTLASGLLLYGALLWFFPLAWLVAVPAALPLLDLAPWSGRFFFDEFDLLLLTTAGVLFLKRPARAPGKVVMLAPALFLGLAAAAVIGSLPGLLPPPPLDANAFSAYWSAYNSVRVGKGLLWGGLLFLLIRRSGADLSRIGGLLALGMGLGLLGVGLTGVWERWLFAGLSDSAQTYRIFATFSSMHTGGSHIEAYLVTALPFLWLGMARLRHALLAVPLMALTVYVTIFTVARGGVLALAVVLLLLAGATLRLAWLTGRRIQAALSLGVFALLAVGLAVGIGGGYFQQRFAQTGQDWQTRVDHWTQAAAMMDGTPMAQMFGMGLGSFPRVYLERGPSDKQATTYGFLTEKDQTWLRLGTGDSLYYAQRVTATAGNSYQLSVDIRSAQAAKLAVPLCEKQMLDSRACVWTEFDVAGDGLWHRYRRELTQVRVGAGGPLNHLPVELFLYHPGQGTVLDVDNLRLLDPNGHDLLCNGSFANGGDCWFFKTHSHLPWHIKNVWVHTLFEQGWLGLILFVALTAFAVARLARTAWRGNRLAWVVLASLSGLLTVGLFDSLLDVPRLATLLWALLLLGGGLPWPAMARASETASG